VLDVESKTRVRNCSLRELKDQKRGVIVGGDSRKAQMKIEVQQIDGEAVIKLSGRLDITTSPDVRKKALTILAKRECKSLTIDITGVSYIDTSGLATLLEILVTAKEKCVI
jgi:anti-anti-sigma factor